MPSRENESSFILDLKVLNIKTPKILLLSHLKQIGFQNVAV